MQGHDHASHQHVAADGSASLAEFFTRLFDSDFMRRGDCVAWRSEIVWLHIVSDATIALAYYSIPFALVYFVRRRRDLAFHWMFLMFAAFILACGTTHVMGIIAFWKPLYRLDGVIKLFTGLLSIGTALALWALIPKALALPSPTDLRRAKDELEDRVRERTAELVVANRELFDKAEERRKSEEHKGFLMAELDHRVKNNLSTVLALAEESLRGATSVQDFSAAFTGRVRSLAYTHAALAAANWEGVRLDELVRIALDPYIQGDVHRAVISGESVKLSSKAATAMCMVLNELATNAAKHGAFSTPDGAGRVRLEWTTVLPRDSRQPGPHLRLEWTESGGPPIRPPARTGVGTELMEGSVSYELGGTITTEYNAEGVRCVIEVPLNEQNTQQGRFERLS